MQEIILEVNTRQEIGKSAVKRIRKQGYIPAIMYGQNETIPISVKEQDINRTFKQLSENILFSLFIDANNKRDVLIKDYQRNVMTDAIEHIDFLEVRKGQQLRTRVPIVLTGSAIGVREGGIQEQHLYELEVECLPKNIPAQFSIDVSGLAVGASLHVPDVIVPEGVKILDDPDTTIVHVSMAKAAASEEAAEAEETETAEVSGD